MLLCAITCVLIHGLRVLIGETEGVGPEIPGRCAGQLERTWGRERE